MKKAILTLGLPGSGKSYWAEQFIMEECYKTGEQNWVEINRDNIRESLYGKGFSFSECDEEEVTRQADELIRTASHSGKNIIISATNLNPRFRRNLVKKLKKFGYSIQVNSFCHVPIEVCIERDKNREKTVGEAVIRKMAEKYYNQLLSPEKEWYKIIFPEQFHGGNQHEKKDCIIVDIDGTICENVLNRDIYDLDKALEDHLNKVVHCFVDNFTWNGKRPIVIILTAREEKYRKVTEQWLDHNEVHHNYLFMRETGDRRVDTVVKAEILENHILPNFNVIFSIEDRLDNCRMYASYGIYTVCVNQGLVEF